MAVEMIYSFFTFAGLAALASAAQPADPLWPTKFSQTFNETTKILTSNTMTGTMYYDYENKLERVDRDNGRWDRYCGLNGVKTFQNTPCSQYVVNGDRYIHYPEKNECCYCCSSEHGCGIVKSTWLTNATFLGVEEHMGVQAYKWDQKGLQHNYYYETISEDPLDRVMISLYQEPNDLQDFSFARNLTVPDDIFTLPSICKKSETCSLLSTCTAARHA
mmetsp:Transcript_27181/g.48803  ORF Transcript_27181/g.48803 Transcript_27181/m.48803 type:complete len:218 (-) Transcript_27181:1527-2180(-)